MIALFVVLGVGCYYHANQYPDYQNFWKGNWTDWRIWALLYHPYWQIYAELDLDYLHGKMYYLLFSLIVVVAINTFVFV